MKNSDSSDTLAPDFSSQLREITRVMADVSAVDSVMSEILRDIDEIAFQCDVLNLDAVNAAAAREVRDLQSQAKELLGVTGKLGSLVAGLVNGELEERRLLGLPDALPVSPSGAALIARQARHFAPARPPKADLSSHSRRAVWLSGFSSPRNEVELEA